MTTNIEWVKSADGTKGATWNPIVGCTRVSPGCQNCYAERMAKRLIAMGQEKYQGTIDKNGRWSGLLNFADEKTINAPLRNKKPTTYFVNSMSDLFHESLSFLMVEAIWKVMYNAPWHTFQILTKRAEFMRERVRELSATFGILENVWLGVSVENQQYADERIPYLLQTPAAIRFLSCEPLLGPTNLDPFLWHNGVGFRLDNSIDWVIVGGESGPDARPMKIQWARQLRDQCQEAGVSFFFKQWGGRDKKAAGRLLDGREWNEMPQREAIL